MVNTQELKAEMVRNGMNQRKLAQKINISVNSLNRKINGIRPFYCDEVNAVCDALGIVDPIRKCKIFLS